MKRRRVILIAGACLLLAGVGGLVYRHLVVLPRRPPGPRALAFPPDRSVGELMVRDRGSTGDNAWEKLGEARGNVAVPVGKEVWLQADRGYTGPGFWDNLLGRLGFGADTHRATDLSFLAALKPNDLHTLDLTDALIDGKQMAHARGLIGLRVLYLRGPGVDEEVLAHVGELTSLRKLVLSRPGSVHDPGLAHLKNLQSLESFSIYSDGLITEEGVAHLAQIKSLRSLSLNKYIVNDAGMALLANLPLLEHLDISVSRVTDAGLVDLKRLKRLRSPALPYGITDAGLPILGELTSLVHLDLGETEITSEGAGKLKRKLPDCRISKYEPHSSCRRRKPLLPSSRLAMPRSGCRSLR